MAIIATKKKIDSGDNSIATNKQKGKKTCSCCKVPKNLTEFYLSYSPMYSIDQRTPICKECCKTYALNEDGTINFPKLKELLRQIDKPLYYDLLWSMAFLALAMEAPGKLPSPMQIRSLWPISARTFSSSGDKIAGIFFSIRVSSDHSFEKWRSKDRHFILRKITCTWGRRWRRHGSPGLPYPCRMHSSKQDGRSAQACRFCL